MDGKRFLWKPPGRLALPVALLPRELGRSRPPGVAPPGETADSAIGVTPGAFVGVRSSGFASWTLLSDVPGAVNDVITLSAEFLVVILTELEGRKLCDGGGDTGGLIIDETLVGACEGVDWPCIEGDVHGRGSSTPVHVKQRIARCC